MDQADHGGTRGSLDGAEGGGEGVRVSLGPFLALVLAAAPLPRADTPIQDEQAIQRAKKRFEAVAGPLDPLAYAPPEVPDSENAASALLEAALAAPAGPDDRAALQSLSRKPASAWSVGEIGTGRRLVEAHGAALVLLDRAASRNRSRFAIDYAQGTFANPPPLLRLLDAAKLAAVDARLAVATADTARVSAGVERIGAVARALEGESMLIVFLVGLAGERIQLDLAAELSASPGLDAALLDRVESALLEGDAAREARRAVALDFAALASTIGEGPRYGPLLADLLDHGSDLLAAATGDWAEVSAGVERVADAARRCREVEGSDEATRRGVTSVHEVLGTWTGPFSRAAAIEASRAVVRFSLEVRRRGLRDGIYPDDVTDDPATATPLSFTGKPLRVERMDDGTAVVEAVGAVEVWRASHGADTPAPPFRVALPAITPPASPERPAAPS
jgi:hypothetical protein